MSYSFEQYHDDTIFTRHNEHNTIAYAILGCIGELGEVLESLKAQNYQGAYDSLSAIDKQAFELLANFQALAEEIEAFKKRVRKEQLTVLPQLQPTADTLEELGGLYWYLNNLTDRCGLCMETVARRNRDLLIARFHANPEWMTNGGKKLKTADMQRDVDLC